MHKTISASELKEFVENNPKLVMRRESKRHPGLFVLKYKREVFYDNLWHLNPLLLRCRGLVVDKDYNVVVEPFIKIFNYGENGTTIDRDEMCVWVRKVNGFLGVATYDARYSDDLIYSTTGSLDSDFVDLIAKHVDPLKDKIMKQVVGSGLRTTFMFEICDETDPHIIAEEYGAWLIGARIFEDGPELLESSVDVVARLIGAKRPERGYARFSDIVKMANECQHEGFMVYSVHQGAGNGKALKIKSPYYLTQKLLARAGENKLIQLLNDPSSAKMKIDEEFYPLIDYISTHRGEFLLLDEQQRLKYMAEFIRDEYHKR